MGLSPSLLRVRQDEPGIFSQVVFVVGISDAMRMHNAKDMKYANICKCNIYNIHVFVRR